MKSRKSLAAFIGVAVSLLYFFAGTMPFRGLTTTEIKQASVKINPPGVTIPLDCKEIAALICILNTVVIYQIDNSYTQYAGQAATYSIEKTDGTAVSVMAYDPFIVIDGTGFRTKRAPCQALNALGNNLRKP